MKKRLLLVLMTLLTTTAIWAAVGDTFTANTVEGVEMTFKVTDEGTKTCSVSSIPGDISGAVTIPATANGYTVTAIGDDAFYECRDLTSISIPSSVTNIGNGAFYYCSGLTSISIPSSVTTIGNYAFFNCSSLTSISIPSSVTSIGNSAFWNCSGLTSLSIPSSVTSIGDEAFYYCEGLTSISIPSSVTSIGEDAFGNCSRLSLVKVEWGNPISISSDVFSNNANMMLNVPVGTKEAYAVADYWKEFNIVEGSIYLGVTIDGICYDLMEDGLKATVVANTAEEYSGEVTIPSSVTYEGNTYQVTAIGYRAFSDCSGLTSISIPSSVTSIGNGAFYYCLGLTSLSIPSSVTSIGDEAFYECWGLTSLSIPSSVTSIGDEAFRGCKSLTSITIPGSVTSIGSNAFNYCYDLSTVKVEWKVPVSISSNVFYKREGVMLNVPVGTKAAYAAASYWQDFNIVAGDIYQGVTIDGICYDLIEDGLKATVVANTATEYSGDITVPSSVTYEGKTYQVSVIGNRAFSDCSGLTSIIIPNSVTSIGRYAFYWCDNLTSVSIPNSVTSISDWAFSSCDKLSSVKVEWYNPVGISSLVFSDRAVKMLNVPLGTKEAYAAASYWQDFNIVEGDIYQGVTIDGICYDLMEDGLKATVVVNTAAEYSGDITVPSSVSYEGKTYQVTAIGSSAFESCYSLSSVSIPSSVTMIGNSAFESSNLTSITIPNSVTSIGNGAFSSCESLTYVSIPSSVTSIGDNAFSSCSSLTSITIPGSVTNIGSFAFAYCSKLTSITIPGSVTSIGSWAFSGCNKLSSVKVEWNNPINISSYVFSNREGKMLSVPLGTKEAYAAASYWQDFNIVEGDIYQGVTIDGICYDLMEDGLKATVVVNTAAKYSGEITIPSSVSYEGKTYQVTAIGSSAFETCYSLNSVSIPNSVTMIGNSAFEGSSLTSVTIPNSVTSIGDDAFSGCWGLTSISIPGSVTSIGSNAFNYCYDLSTVKVEWEFPVSISSNVFYEREGVMLNVPVGTKAAYAAASYWQDFNIVAGDIYQGVTIDGICYDLIEDGLKATVVANTAAKYSGEITIPSSVSYEGKTYQVTAIGSSAFESCYSLNSVSIPSSVTSIGKNAFYDAPKLSTVRVEWEIPVSISSDVFSNNANMMLNVPVGTKAAYEAADYWQDFDIVEGNIYQGVTIDGISYNLLEDGLQATVVANTTAVYSGDITIPSSVTYNEKIYQVTAIGSSAFSSCYSLSSVSIPSSVTMIGNSAFIGSSLTSVTIPNSVTSIGDDAFYNCWGLTSITIPGSVTSIGSWAFYNCDKLSTVKVEWKIPVSISSDVFSNREGVMLNVPAGTKAAYEAAEYWQEFDIAEGVSTTISSAGWATLYTDRALDFSGMEGLTAYTATLSGTTVTLTPVNDVPAGSGVVLKGAGGTYNIPAIASSATDGGDLKGSATEDLTYDANAANDYYMLALNDAGNAQFAKLTGGTITAGKAYLEVARSAARMLSIVVANGDATGIDAIEHTQPSTSNDVYSLNGQRVSQPQKGLYIVGGKKVIIK